MQLLSRNISTIQIFTGIAFTLCISLSLLSCNPAKTQAQATSNTLLPSRDSVRNTLRSARALAIVYPETSPRINDYLDWAETIQKNSRYYDIIIVGDQHLPDSILTDYPLLLIGQLGKQQLLTDWISELPIQPIENGFQFQGNDYISDDHSIFLTWYPHPTSRLTPITVLSGNSDEAILAGIRSSERGNGFGFSFGRWDYQVFEGEDKRLIGNYTEDWRPDLNARWEFSADQSPISANSASHIYLHEVEDTGISSVIADSILARKSRFEAWTGTSLPDIPLEVHLYGHPETMGLAVGEMLTGFRKRNTLHRIVHPEFIGQDPGLEWTVWIEQTLGKAALPILEDGLRVWFTPHFQGHGYHSLGASLLRAEGLLTTNTMLDPTAYQRESPLVRDCYAGMFVDFLLKYLGKDEFINQYQTATEMVDDEEMNRAWHRYQTRLAASEPQRKAWKVLPEFQQGMTLAHEGYQVYNGYGSRQAEKALHYLGELGSNAIAIVPYTGTSNPQSSQPLRWSRGAGGENDASVMLSHYGTHQAGMITMLKPQVWVRGGWPGDVDMADEAEWERWFDNYHRWIRHYALLAEIHQMEILCLGTEFRYATMKHPDRWRDLIHRMREIYHGTITYAANWGEETEHLGFADALDFVGVNFYYPLSESDSPTDEELLASMEHRLSSLDKLSESWGKPYVLTEIGYRSITAPWKHPHADAGNAAMDETDQARCYRAVFTALPNHPRCQGLYWWKWPSHDRYAHRVPKSFTPCGKEAEALLKSAYLSR